MARIAGVDLPKNKPVFVALQSIYGLGRKTALDICKDLNLWKRTQDLTDADVAQIRSQIQSQYKVEGDLRREVSLSIKRLMDLNTHRGQRHRKGLPVRGQNTRTNCRTRKGPRKTVANKKKAVK